MLLPALEYISIPAFVCRQGYYSLIANAFNRVEMSNPEPNRRRLEQSREGGFSLSYPIRLNTGRLLILLLSFHHPGLTTAGAPEAGSEIVIRKQTK
ncbi:MAG TPA: hypothetical protein PKG92_07315 [Anaerolineaceae bacterium]|jgi:hypothetical protein|nr:hypothetical protein [Anaerolineaceae bacterium]